LAFASAALVAAATDDDHDGHQLKNVVYVHSNNPQPVRIQYWAITETQIPASSRKWPEAPFLPLVPVF
jgi:hypothetical protein